MEGSISCQESNAIRAMKSTRYLSAAAQAIGGHPVLLAGNNIQDRSRRGKADGPHPAGAR